MRHVEVNGTRMSAIGLGTWQFGSREWGYGDDYAREEAVRILDRALELGITLIDTAEIYGFGVGADHRPRPGRAPQGRLPRHQGVPGPAARADRRAAGPRERGAAADRHHRPLPDPLAQPGRAHRAADGRHAPTAEGRRRRPRRREQLLARAVAGGGALPRIAGAVEPGAVQPGRAQAPTGTWCRSPRPTTVSSSRTARWARACSRPSTTPPTRPRARPAPPTPCSCPRTSSAPTS